MILLALMGCEPEVQCDEATACPFGEVCVEGVCESVACATSVDCGMEQHCEGRTCVEGCAEDSDCWPGDVCDLASKTCIARGCRDTQLDCGYREFCNEANGECYETTGYYCRPCEDDSNCGSEDNICLNFGSGRQYCGVYCEDDQECPSGFGCLPVGDINGNIISFQCITYCWLYDDYDGTFPSDKVSVDDTLVLWELDPTPVCEVEL
ncbi:MAG TPA: hypothetical protein QGF58_10600 [Myxococcota bacterium]|nr:hypothetical protein [Myxococcota bacterium]